jgi:hypothetical protein
MVGDSLPVLRLPPPLKLVAIILLKVALNTINQIKSEFSVGGDKKNKKIRRTIQIGISFRLNCDYSSLIFNYH